jgi:hypothetical protein
MFSMLKHTQAQAGQMHPSHCKTEAASEIQLTKAAPQASLIMLCLRERPW